MIQHANLPIDDRLITHFSSDVFGDSGVWEMAVNVLEVRVPIISGRTFYNPNHSELRHSSTSCLPRVRLFLLFRAYQQFTQVQVARTYPYPSSSFRLPPWFYCT